MKTDVLLETRHKTHGQFSENARVSQQIQKAYHYGKWETLTPVQKESLQFIAHKIGRILSGNPNELDHWKDIAGYARLAELGGNK